MLIIQYKGCIMRYEKRTRTFYPKEGQIIAAFLEKKADDVEAYAVRVNRIKDELDSSWEGNAKNRFIAEFENMPSEVRSYAAELRACARKVRAITMTEEYTVEVDD